MIQTHEYKLMRGEHYKEWCAKQQIPGMSQETFAEIFAFLLSEQLTDGSWPAKGNEWSVVQTAVVLKSLASMEFRRGDSWKFNYASKSVIGSIDSAVEFLKGKLQEQPNSRVGEDYWDTCQVLLALEALGISELGNAHANLINDRWNDLYREDCTPGRDVWCGPAFLSAMVEVLHRYNRLEKVSQVDSIVTALLAKEAEEGHVPTGRFSANQSDPGYDRWNTCLVLRTLCSLRDANLSALIERTSAWVLKELNGWEALAMEARMRPMYLARCLEGLRGAVERVNPAMRQDIHRALKQGNDRLQKYWTAQPRIGDLKAYTAVGEYLAGEILRAPAGLLWDLASTLPSEIVVAPIVGPSNEETSLRLPPRLRSMLRLKALPGWFLLLSVVWERLVFVHDSIETAVSMQNHLKLTAVLTFLGHWGWLLGVFWLTTAAFLPKKTPTA
jgi:hypothetical protein